MGRDGCPPAEPLRVSDSSALDWPCRPLPDGKADNAPLPRFHPAPDLPGRVGHPRAAPPRAARGRAGIPRARAPAGGALLRRGARRGVGTGVGGETAGQGVVCEAPELFPADWSPRLRVLSFDIETDPAARRLLAIGLY